jgi:hypothetical protein
MGRCVPTICYISFFHKETEIDFNRIIYFFGGGGDNINEAQSNLHFPVSAIKRNPKFGLSVLVCVFVKQQCNHAESGGVYGCLPF